MNAVYGVAARLCSVARPEKRDTKEVRNVVAKNADVWAGRGAENGAHVVYDLSIAHR